jgi:GGDEF domain-containing protein
MSLPARPLRTTVVSPDIEVLHDLCWMLSAVGYEVVTSQDTSDQAAWRQFSDTDFLFFDGRLIDRPTPAALALQSDKPLYRIFLYDPSVSNDMAAWFAAGANDGLCVPINRGELLVRARVGARMLEFENRMRSRSSRSLLPGTHSTHGLLRKLNKLSDRGPAEQRYLLLTTAIDLFDGFCRQSGETAAQKLLTTLATTIHQCVSAKSLTAYDENGTFRILHPELTVEDAEAVAERISQTFRESQAELSLGPHLTLTTSIVPWQSGVTPHELLEQGAATLVIGRQSGGDCTVGQSTFAQELSNWQTELTAGSPFANVNAQDIMEPFPAVLQRDTPDRAMLAALRRSSAPVWPFVDRDGHLVGAASPALDTDDAETSITNQLDTSPATIAYNATFPEIYEAFSAQACLEMIVVADRRPVGYITCRGFTSMLERLDSTTFQGEDSAPDDSRGLLVGSSINEYEESSGID